MCIWRKKYYYQVYNYDDGKIYYIMCENCYKLLPKYLKEKHCNPSSDNFLFKFENNNTKVLVEEIVKNNKCEECQDLNGNNFYENMSFILKTKPIVKR